MSELYEIALIDCHQREADRNRENTDLRAQLAEANAWRVALWGLINPDDLDPNKPLSPELVADLIRNQRAAAQAALRGLRQDLEASQQRVGDLEADIQKTLDDVDETMTVELTYRETVTLPYWNWMFSVKRLRRALADTPDSEESDNA